MTVTYRHVLPDLHPAGAKYVTPHSAAIEVAYKPRPESFSEQVVRLMSSRPREKVVVCKVKPDKHRYDYDDAWHPIHLNHVSGKRGLSRDQVARLERRLYSPEPAVIINNRIHSNRHLYERERRLPPLSAHGDVLRTIAVSPGPAYVPLPRSHNHHYYRPRVHRSGDIYAPYVMEVVQRR